MLQKSATIRGVAKVRDHKGCCNTLYLKETENLGGTSIKKIRKFLPSQIFLNNEKFVVQIENFFGKWNLYYHFVSIDFHEFEIYGIITPTMKIFEMENK